MQSYFSVSEADGEGGEFIKLVRKVSEVEKKVHEVGEIKSKTLMLKD